MTQGVLVQVFEHDRPETLQDGMREQLRQEAATITSDRRLAVDGRPAFRIDYQLGRGIPHGAQIMVIDGDEVYWIACVYKEDPEFAKKGCDKVVDTFEISGLFDRPGQSAGGRTL